MAALAMLAGSLALFASRFELNPSLYTKGLIIDGAAGGTNVGWPGFSFVMSITLRPSTNSSLTPPSCLGESLFDDGESNAF